MVRIIRIIYLVLFVFFTYQFSNADSPSEIKSNILVLENFIQSTLVELIQNDPFTAKDTVVFDVISNDTTFSQIQLSFIRGFLYDTKKLNILSKSKSSSKYNKKVTFQWLNWEITYTQMKKRFWQKKRFQRNLKADFFVEVFSYTNMLLYSKKFEKEFEDIVKKDEIAKVQSPDLEFTLGNIEEKRGLVNKVIEPVFLFAISGTVIYLFYSIRSQ